MRLGHSTLQVTGRATKQQAMNVTSNPNLTLRPMTSGVHEVLKKDYTATRYSECDL